MPFSARTGCLLVSLVGFLLVLLCLVSVQLLSRGELRWGWGELRENRIWLLREGETQGMGLSSMHVVSGSERSGLACVETRVRFWFWSGSQPDPGTTYCECFETVNGKWRSAGGCPE
jgi:hypothetical protein